MIYEIYKKLTVSIITAALVAALFSGCAGGGLIDNSSEKGGQSASGGSAKNGELSDKHELFDDGLATFLKIIGTLESTENYKWTTSGDTRAKKGIIDYVQNVNSSLEKNGEKWTSVSKSSSLFVNLEHEVGAYGGTAKYKDSREDGEKTVGYEEYRKKFGVLPCDKGFAGYIINSRTVLSAVNKCGQDGLYTLEAELSPNSAANMKIQMKNFGGLNDYPAFERIAFSITYDEHFRVVSYVTSATYDIDINVLGKMKCVMSMQTACTYD